MADAKARMGPKAAVEEAKGVKIGATFYGEDGGEIATVDVHIAAPDGAAYLQPHMYFDVPQDGGGRRIDSRQPC